MAFWKGGSLLESCGQRGYEFSAEIRAGPLCILGQRGRKIA